MWMINRKCQAELTNDIQLNKQKNFINLKTWEWWWKQKKNIKKKLDDCFRIDKTWKKKETKKFIDSVFFPWNLSFTGFYSLHWSLLSLELTKITTCNVNHWTEFWWQKTKIVHFFSSIFVLPNKIVQLLKTRLTHRWTSHDEQSKWESRRFLFFE